MAQPLLRSILGPPQQRAKGTMFTTLLGTPTKDAFARALIDTARKLNDIPQVAYDKARFRLGLADAQGHLNLHNIYEEFLVAGLFARRSLLKRYVKLIAQSHTSTIPDTFRRAQPNLLPRVRERSYHSLTKLYYQREGLETEEPAYRVISDHLVVELAYDMPDSIMTINQSTIDDWGVGVDMALDLAIQNLADATQSRFVSPARGVYVSNWRDNYDASRLVLIDLIRELDVQGDPVAMVPHRDALIITGSEDVNGLAKMVDLTDDAASETRFMTAIPVRLQWNEWVPYELPDDHELAPRFELLRAQTFARNYDEQHASLEALHECCGKDIFVASYSAARKEDIGAIESYCVWSKNLVSLLPQTDIVYFYDDDAPEEDQLVATASWERVQAVVPNLMMKQNLCPPRYLVDTFPSKEQLAELGRLP